MITKAEAAVVLKRLERWAEFYPKEDKEAVRELREALESADTPEIASAVVDEWFRDNHKTPRPEQLRAMIFDKNAPRLAADPDCQLCAGSGVRIVSRMLWTAYDEQGNCLGRRQKAVLSEPAGWAEADAMDARAQPTVFSAGEDCSCRRAASKAPSPEKREAGLMRVAPSGEVL